LLLRIAEAGEGLSVHPTTTVLLRRLADFGLVQILESPPRAWINPLVRAYLVAEGELAQLLPQTLARGDSGSPSWATADPDVERSKAILRGIDAPFEEIVSLAEKLQNGRYFGYARRLFERARQQPEARRLPAARSLKLVQRHALCTYRDLDLPSTRFAEALEILQGGRPFRRRRSPGRSRRPRLQRDPRACRRHL
jgi:hypothetical protein